MESCKSKITFLNSFILIPSFLWSSLRTYSYDKLFTFKIHYSDRFTRPPGRRYRLGEISYVDLIDCHLFSIDEYVAMLDELGLEKLFYVEEDVSVVEQHMIEEMERIIFDQFAFRVLLAEIDLEFGNKSIEMKDKLSQENPSINETFDDFNSSLNNIIANLSQDDMDMPWGMVAPDTIDDASIRRLEADEVELELEDEVADANIFADLDQAYDEDFHSHLKNEANEVELELEDEIAVVVISADLDEAYDEDVDSHLDEALVREEVGDLGTFYNSIDDYSVDKPNEIELEVEDEVGVADIFAELEQAYEEDIDSHLDKTLVLEEVGDLGFLITYVLKCFTEKLVKENNVPIGRPRKRKRVEYDETYLGYAPTGNPMKRIKLNKDERYTTDFVDDVEE
uniref:Uncharacterized protein n=1 Tax=Tanacetum cinerariifolium TaxID=118510 RepID=A0A6L2JA22_TANCI|nr:hypothetical protein [Tanacetum cinerariifolium]